MFCIEFSCFVYSKSITVTIQYRLICACSDLFLPNIIVINCISDKYEMISNTEAGRDLSYSAIITIKLDRYIRSSILLFGTVWYWPLRFPSVTAVHVNKDKSAEYLSIIRCPNTTWGAPSYIPGLFTSVFLSFLFSDICWGCSLTQWWGLECPD